MAAQQPEYEASIAEKQKIIQETQELHRKAAVEKIIAVAAAVALAKEEA